LKNLEHVNLGTPDSMGRQTNYNLTHTPVASAFWLSTFLIFWVW